MVHFPGTHVIGGTLHLFRMHLHYHNNLFRYGGLLIYILPSFDFFSFGCMPLLQYDSLFIFFPLSRDVRFVVNVSDSDDIK